MIKKQAQSLAKNILSTGPTLDTMQFWNELQRDHLAEDLTVIEYEDKQKEDNPWRCYRSAFQKKDTQHKPVKYQQLNTDLKACFIQSDFINSAAFWEAIEHQLQWAGFFMPTADLQRLDKHQLVQELDFLKLLHTNFPYIPYLATLKEVSLQKDHIQEPLPIIAIWQFLRYYADLLNQLSIQQSTIFQSMTGWYMNRLQVEAFQHLLPSEQITRLLYITCEVFFWDTIGQVQRSQLLAVANPAVQTFFAKHTNNLNILFEAGFSTIDSTSAGAIEQVIQQAYYQVCQLDLIHIEIQELLDNESKMDFKNQLPNLLHFLTPQEEKRTLKDRITSVFTSFSEKVKGEPVLKHQPSYVPTPTVFIKEEALKWYDLEENLFEKLTAAVDHQLKDRIKLFARIRWHKHLQNLGNLFTTPVIIWEHEKKGCFPAWNIFDLFTSKNLETKLTKKLESEKVERKRLNTVLTQLKKLKQLPDIDGFYAKVPSFGYKLVQQDWNQAVKRHRIIINNRNKFRLRRMREFGIVEGKETTSDRKDIWLDEMLRIEEEIRPYILYVRQAFQAALPISRTVEFHPYRHNHDGVEFDPTTLQDQDKWLRARVMKTLRNKVKQGEVEQVNTFCLDFSGSMEHDKMRNLYKLLFLLIYGLEDRKSYDAVHFFSTEFIETANFSKDYTNRALLFKVLSRVGVISAGKIRYRGLGGTNISDGIQNCHQRILDFAKNIRGNNPTINIACSLFVITDGEPSLGVYDPEALHDFIEEKRKLGNVAIKGIYIKPAEEDSTFLPTIFGQEHYIETTEFKDAVDKFVAIMTKTYREQRKEFKWHKKKKRLEREVKNDE